MIFYISLSLIYSRYSYSTPSTNLLRGASPAMAREKCLKKLAERRHIALGWQAQRISVFCITLHVPSSHMSVRGSSFEVEVPTTEKARLCFCTSLNSCSGISVFCITLHVPLSHMLVLVGQQVSETLVCVL